MSPVCPRCGGELRPASINAWVHVWQDKEDDCYMRGKDGVGDSAKPVQLTAGQVPSPVPANPDGTTTEPSHPNVAVGDSLPTKATRGRDDYDATMTPSEIRHSIEQGQRLPKREYAFLVAYASSYKTSALHRWDGRVYLSKYATWTDAEITEALR